MNTGEVIAVAALGCLVLVELWTIFAVSLLAHELGHALAARRLHIPVRRIVIGVGPRMLRLGRLEARLLPVLGLTDVVGGMHALDQRRRAPIAVAGPAASAALGLALLGLAAITTGHAAAMARAVGTMNVGIAAVNLLPVPLLDGWTAIERHIFAALRVQPSEAQRVRLYKGGALVLLALLLMTIIVEHMRC